MKYFTGLAAITLFTTTVSSQGFDYKSSDVGAEIQWQQDGGLLSVQLAFNVKAHHTVIFRVGYNKIQTGSAIHNFENGDGWGGSLGYRYYIKDVPLKLFTGLRIDASKMNVHWSNPSFEGNTRLAFLQPTVEGGYTFLFNDKFFITPNFAIGYQIKIYSKGENIAYGKGIVPQAGVSAGWRF